MSLFDVRPIHTIYAPKSKGIVLIDGTNMFCRACLARHSDSKNDLSITVSNFCKMFKKAISSKPRYIAVVFDSSKPNFRHALYPKYKSNRSTVIEDKLLKLRVIKAILHYYGFTVLDSGAYEADDTIGSLCAILHKDYNVVIHSEDKDFLQCVSKRVSLYKGGVLYDERECLNKFGVRPNQFTDYLSLVGDCADCIPGASKWGKVYASRMLAQCGTIEGILKSGLPKSLMSIHETDIALMRALTRIKTDIPVIQNVSELSVAEADDYKLERIAEKYNVDIAGFYG
jgi:DNA polymerase I